MKPTFIFAAITVVALFFSSLGSAQQVQPVAPAIVTDTLPKIKMDSIAASVLKTGNVKTTKKAKRKKKESYAAHNPYVQPGNVVVKPLPYNSNKETSKPLEKPPIPVGEILKDVILPKKNN